MRERTALLPFLMALGAVLSCAAPPPPAKPLAHGSAALRLKPLGAPVPENFLHRRVHVSVYSSIQSGPEPEPAMVSLSPTISVRNVSAERPLVLIHARFHDSTGKAVRDHLDTPSELAPMATVEYVVKRDDLPAGPGATFVIEWAGPATMDDPIVEALMIGRSGQTGFSFISQGKKVQHRAAEPESPPGPKPRSVVRSSPSRKPVPKSTAKPAVRPTPLPTSKATPRATPKPTGDRSHVRRPARPSPTPKVPARKGDSRKE